TNDELAWLAEKAQVAGAKDETIHYFRLLAVRDPGNAAQWHSKLGDSQLSGQDYEDAAAAYFSDRDAATTLEGQREYFQAGVNAFLSGNMVDRAIESASHELGALAEDAPTLRYMINLARQSGKPQLVAEYARKLLEVGRKKPDVSQQSNFDGGDDDPTHVSDTVLWRRDGWRRSYAFYRPGVHPGREVVMQGATPPMEEDDYDIAFRAFVESQALDDAERTAEIALESGLPVATWA